MWIPIIPNEERHKRDKEAAAEMVKQWEEAAEKRKALSEWVKRNTCPHCSLRPPIPPWLM